MASLILTYVRDIIYEENGSFDDGSALSGHVAMVEREVTDPNGVRYWRLIDAASGEGVVYSVLDDERFIKRKGYILKVDSTEEQRKQAVEFCVDQIGDRYWPILSVPGVVFPLLNYADDWMCSLLVWAAYYDQGIDFMNFQNISPHLSYSAAMPTDIYYSSLTTETENFYNDGIVEPLDFEINSRTYNGLGYHDYGVTFINPTLLMLR